MPDLNLIDEGNLEETPAPAAPAPRRGGGGGGSRGVIIAVVLIIVLGGGGFFLYKKGIFPFKKRPAAAVTQLQEEQVPAEPSDQNMAQQEQQVPTDTSAVSLVETTPIGDKGSAKKGMEMKGTKPETTPSGSAEMSSAAGKLSDMRGDYTIQVVAFHEQKKAEEIVENLEAADYPAFVEKIPLKEGEWYTVRIGRYPTAKEARTAVKSFASQLQSSYFIDRVRSK